MTVKDLEIIADALKMQEFENNLNIKGEWIHDAHFIAYCEETI